jgi:hypothetical protein
LKQKPFPDMKRQTILMMWIKKNATRRKRTKFYLERKKFSSALVFIPCINSRRKWKHVCKILRGKKLGNQNSKLINLFFAQTKVSAELLVQG